MLKYFYAWQSWKSRRSQETQQLNVHWGSEKWQEIKTYPQINTWNVQKYQIFIMFLLIFIYIHILYVFFGLAFGALVVMSRHPARKIAPPVVHFDDPTSTIKDTFSFSNALKIWLKIVLYVVENSHYCYSSRKFIFRVRNIDWLK